MEEEDSKELANAGSYGARAHFEAKGRLTGDDLGKIVGANLLEMARDVSARGGMVGHLKAFVRLPGGFLKVNVVDQELGADISGTAGASLVTSGTMNVMVVAIGIDDCQAKEVLESGLKGLDGRVRILKLEDGHDEGAEHKMISLG